MKFKVTTETTVYGHDACQYIREEDGKEKITDLMVTTYTPDTDLLTPKQFFLRKDHDRWGELHSINFNNIKKEWLEELDEKLGIDKTVYSIDEVSWLVKDIEDINIVSSTYTLNTNDETENTLETPLIPTRNISPQVRYWVDAKATGPQVYLITRNQIRQLIEGQNEANADGFPCYVWDIIWPHGINKLYHVYSDHVPRILYIPNPRQDDSITNVEDVSKVPTPKIVSYDVCMFNGIYPDGHEKTMDSETYQFPAGSYFRLDETKLPAMSYEFCHKNEVLTINGVKMDNVTFDGTGWIKDGTKHMSNIRKFGRGFYRFMGYLAEDLLELGYKSSVEYSNIQDHITTEKTVTCKKDTTTGQFLFVGNGSVKIRWAKDTENQDDFTFKPGDLIIINEDVEIYSGDGNAFDVYECYQVKDKSSLYG